MADRSARRSLLVSLTLSLALLVAGTALANSGEPPSGPEDTSPARTELSGRELFGLSRIPPADAILDPELEMRLTMAEREKIDRRTRFVAEVVELGLLDQAEQLDGFDSAYFDAEGNLHLRFDAADRSRAEQVLTARHGQRLLTHDGLGVTVHDAGVAYEDLRRDVDLLVGNHALRLDNPVVAAAIDVERQTIIVELADEVTERDRQRLLRRPWRTDAPLQIGVGEYAPVACSSRTNCIGPMRAGIGIRRSSSGTDPQCTMGFNIRKDTARSFLTAGHCSYNKGTTWYHPGYKAGALGSVQNNLYGVWMDAMRVNMPNGQASNRIYGESTRLVTGTRTPEQGLSVCASLAKSAAIRCGQVTTGYTSWTDTNGVKSWGNRASMTFVGGDSGSPIYVRASSTSARAVGIVNTTTGYFGSAPEALQVMGWSLVTS